MAKLFNITHDANNLNEYNSTVTDGGDLSTGTPGLTGTTAKMEALIDDTNAIYGEKNQAIPGSNQIRFRIYLDPNTLAMDNGENVTVLVGDTSGPGNYFARIYLRKDSGNYELLLRQAEDDNTKSSHAFIISDATHYVEIHVERASSDVAADGRVRYWVDGNLEFTDDNLDNFDTLDNMDKFRVGALGFVGTPSGTLHLDEFIANDDGSEIGPVAAVRIPRYGFTNFQVPGIV